MTLIRDEVPNLHNAYKKEFWTQNNPRNKYIQYIRLPRDHNNNKKERMNGDVRDREKVMRVKEG